jgi:hypothetical protein
VTGKELHPDGVELQKWLEGDLSGEARDQLAGHLENCTRCRSEIQSFELLFDGLEAVEQTVATEPGPQFSRRVMADILSREVAGRVRRNRVMVPAVVAACFALILALWLLPSSGMPAAAESAGGLALPVLLGAMLKIVHSGALMVFEGFHLAIRLARTAAVLLATLPVAVWAICLALFCAVHGALVLCLKQYSRQGSLGQGSFYR